MPGSAGGRGRAEWRYRSGVWGRRGSGLGRGRYDGGGLPHIPTPTLWTANKAFWKHLILLLNSALQRGLFEEGSDSITNVSIGFFISCRAWGQSLSFCHGRVQMAPTWRYAALALRSNCLGWLHRWLLVLAIPQAQAIKYLLLLPSEAWSKKILAWQYVLACYEIQAGVTQGRECFLQLCHAAFFKKIN